MKELADSIRSVFEKIAEFFDIFDLSFLVSGITALAAALTWPPLRQALRLQIQSTPAKYLLFFVGAYVSGLCCFAAGRFLRMERRGEARYEAFDNLVYSLLAAHGLLQRQPFAAYVQRLENRGLWRLYIRLWAEARRRLHPSPTLSLLNRYWVLAATYDGVAVALLAWVSLFVLWAIGLGFDKTLSLWAALPAIALLLVLSFACFREAGRYVRNQAEELVASLAAAIEADGQQH